MVKWYLTLPPLTLINHAFKQEDWSHTLYYDATEKLPENMPTARRKEFTIREYIDADHAGKLVTRRCRTGFICFLNNSPIYWSSKKQTGIETSSFGSKYIAMESCCEYL